MTREAALLRGRNRGPILGANTRSSSGLAHLRSKAADAMPSHLYDMSHVGREALSEVNSNDDEYNSWQYGDEASLYSIAENSREDRASEVASNAGTDAVSTAGGNKVDVSWAEVEGIKLNRAIVGRHGEEMYYGYQPPSRRMYALAACMIVFGLIAIVLGVTLAKRDENAPRSSVGQSISKDPLPVPPAPSPATVPSPTIPVPSPVAPIPSPTKNPVAKPSPVAPIPSPTKTPFAKPSTVAPIPSPTETPVATPSLAPIPSPQLTPVATPTTRRTLAPSDPPTTTTPSVLPSPAPSPQLIQSTAYILAQGFVTSALKTCPGSTSFEDKSSAQGQAFDKIAKELLANVVVGSDGFVNFPLEFGSGYIREKYALEMLYLATNGDTWLSSTDWLSDSDPCVGWYGIASCQTRNEGSCAVLQVNLGKSMCWLPYCVPSMFVQLTLMNCSGFRLYRQQQLERLYS
jgi:hypothetical protein